MAKKVVKELSLGEYNVHLNISSCVDDQNLYVFQFGKGDPELQTFGSMKISDSEIVITSNSFAGKRIYYWQIANDLFITDDVFNFISEHELNQLEKNPNEFEFFKRHNYSTGESTVYNIIKKIPPFANFKVDKNGIKVDLNYNLKSIINTPDEDLFREAIYNSVKETLKPLINIHRPVVLCFSGGKDSTYLAKMMIELGISFDLYFFRDTSLKINSKEVKKAHQEASKLGKKLNFIDITNVKDHITDENIRKFNLFDKHYCRYHFYGHKALREKYGENLIIVNGQNSDSILSYGPSEEKLSSKMKRYLLYGENMLLKKLFASIIGILFKTKFSVPTTQLEREIAFFDNFKYCLLLQDSKSSYTSYIKGIIQNLKQRLGDSLSTESLLMYLKSYTHMQGSDAQVVTGNRGVDIIMPLATSKVMEATLKYKDNSIELNHPKYALTNWKN